MRYLLTLVCSPAAVLLCDRPAQAAINGAIWALALVLMLQGFWWLALAPVVHAFLVVQRFESDRHLEEMVLALNRAPRSRS
ncbi:MAG TPA: hypothetical protein VFC51_10800 [Chloroflexota bacterium]|nr:hypothetical protein [Chloroflexota bacterium]